MLTGEYFVLDGAKAIALPTKLGQRMVVKSTKGSDLIWKSYDQKGDIWFESKISLYDFSAVKTNAEASSETLKELLKGAVRLNSEFLNNWNAFKVETFLEFPLEWGLGSSSTLTYMLAEWADINPFLLHFKVSNGSGYDVACAGSDGPIIYELGEESLHYEEVDWNPSFKKNMHFVYLNKKQSSKDAVIDYAKKVKSKKSTAKKLTELSNQILACKDLGKFQKLLQEHENIIGNAIGKTPIHKEKFSDFNGMVKSLGAWGGDFALCVSELSTAEQRDYFQEKGYDTFVPYEDIILD